MRWPLAAGKLTGITVSQPVQLHQIEQFPDTFADILLVRALTARLRTQPESDVLEKSSLAERGIVLKHEAYVAFADISRQRISPSKRTSPASGHSRPAMIRSSVVLPEPRRSEQRDQFARTDFQIYVVERGENFPNRLLTS